MATAPWSVRVELAVAGEVSDDVVDELADRLADFAPAVSVEDDARVALHLTVGAGTMRAAFTRAEKAVADAAAGLMEAEPVAIEVMTQQEFDLRLLRPRVPELWGVTEAAEFLGVSPARIDQLVKEQPEKLPMVAKLAGRQGARIWLAGTWRRFAAGWERKRGRPAKAAAAPPAEHVG
ncbi:hypothetical protein [Actinoplanes sp. G11-F43]|uniref:hypothetical protein n=1 Tax=Actinoplanes sp. G11-F43 TaxID=3424130 RepID=UPI003D33925A